jgi:ribonucleoside-diphosphate reductase alpha chain
MSGSTITKAEDTLVQNSPEPVLTDNALEVLKRRYLAKAEDGKTVIETPKQLFWRVASNLAQAERNYWKDPVLSADAQVMGTAVQFYQLMAHNCFLPNSPTLMNAGRDLQQLSACFVLPVGDSIDEIFSALKQQAIIHKTGGGTGFSFSRLRPKNDIVRSTSGVASGPVSFMQIFDAATEQVKQGGTRRGANMAILRVDHPDILEFIDMKMDPQVMKNFNVSVALTDEFMEAWKKDLDFELRNPKTKRVVGKLHARTVMDKIAHNAWKSGEPGLFFIDRANATNPVPHVGLIEATNPCGEQDLHPYDSCNLGSIVLDRHLVESECGNGEVVDWHKLEQTIKTAVRFLDNVIDMNKYPLPEIEAMSKGMRRIGLGVMGFARMLFRLGIPYDSKEGLDFAERLMGFIQEQSHLASRELAKERGPYGFWKEGLPYRRNSYVTTIAPTGTISMIANTSGGCEPEFSLIWYKNVMDGTHLPYVLEEFMQRARWEGFYYDGLESDILADHILDRAGNPVSKFPGSCRGLPRVPEQWQRIFAVAADVAPEWHVRMQAAFQKHVDAAVSKTINLPKTATEQQVKDAYLLAFELGCKGITVYRDGSRKDQVLNVGVSEKADGASKIEAQVEGYKNGTNGTHNGNGKVHTNGNGVAHAHSGNGSTAGLLSQLRKRPTTVNGVTQKIETGFGTLYVTINEDDHGIVELFANLGKSGGYTAAFVEAIGRMTSLALRSGIDPEIVIRQLAGIRSPKISFDQREQVFSVPDAIAKALRRYLEKKRGEKIQDDSFDAMLHKSGTPECVECSAPLTLEEGCIKCRSCGWSQC